MILAAEFAVPEISADNFHASVRTEDNEVVNTDFVAVGGFVIYAARRPGAQHAAAPPKTPFLDARRLMDMANRVIHQRTASGEIVIKAAKMEV